MEEQITQQPIQDETTEIPKNTKWYIIIWGIVFLLFVLFVIFLLYYFLRGNTPTSTTSTNPTPAAASKYYTTYKNNKLGIQILYPIQTDVKTKCVASNGSYTSKDAMIPVGVYENPSTNTIYIAGIEMSILEATQVAPGVYRGTSSCLDKAVTLQDLENTTTSLTKKQNIVFTKFAYAAIRTQSDLLAFVQAQFGNSVAINSQKLVNKDSGEYQVILKDTGQIQLGEDPASLTDQVIYSPSKQLAVAWYSSAQAYLWQVINPNNTYSILNPPSPSFIH